ncbi:hypothetical protein ABZY57_18065, partial [Streptomyces sp. NPDC006450]|uniref:hypothetical protein n=1 Tax=Streptomyces sp. NPDC006450 TaxID=3155458 RepID=UPI0033A5D797
QGGQGGQGGSRDGGKGRRQGGQVGGGQRQGGGAPAPANSAMADALRRAGLSGPDERGGRKH